MAKNKVKPEMNLIASNRKARHNYEIVDTWEAGIKLIGIEVKALRQGNISLDESYIKVTDNKVELVGCSINPSRVPEWQEFNHRRNRILLLKKTEIKKIKGALVKGFTAVPLKIYFNSRNLAKIQIATARGKKLHDKRKTIRDRDLKRYGH